MNKQKIVLITVGTTKFENLIKTTDRNDFVKILHDNGYIKLIYQIGKGQYIPSHGQNFRLTPHINQYYQKADLIISHGGAGTLLQNLIHGKLMIAIPNEELHENHQVQLINKLANEGYLLGFKSIQDFQNGTQIIDKFLKLGNVKKYERPQRCIMNQIVFGDFCKYK